MDKKSSSANVKKVARWKEVRCFSEISNFIGLMCQGFGCGQAAEVVFVWSVQNLPCIREKPVPDVYKRDLPLAKSEPMSKTGCASGRTDLRKGKKKKNVVQYQL